MDDDGAKDRKLRLGPLHKRIHEDYDKHLIPQNWVDHLRGIITEAAEEQPGPNDGPPRRNDLSTRLGPHISWCRRVSEQAEKSVQNTLQGYSCRARLTMFLTWVDALSTEAGQQEPLEATLFAIDGLERASVLRFADTLTYAHVLAIHDGDPWNVPGWEWSKAVWKPRREFLKEDRFLPGKQATLAAIKGTAYARRTCEGELPPVADQTFEALVEYFDQMSNANLDVTMMEGRAPFLQPSKTTTFEDTPRRKPGGQERLDLKTAYARVAMERRTSFSRAQAFNDAVRGHLKMVSPSPPSSEKMGKSYRQTPVAPLAGNPTKNDLGAWWASPLADALLPVSAACDLRHLSTPVNRYSRGS